MPIRQIEFTDIEKEIRKTSKSFRDYFAPELGKAYVVAITRNACPACEKQKPQLNKLAEAVSKKHGEDVVFIRVHINQPQGDTTESLRAKNLFGHYFYPTNLILFRTKDRGTIELYKNASPDMTELEKNIESALEAAKALAKETG
jgi:thiol-disulfide isomerase/thioredoxin